MHEWLRFYTREPCRRNRSRRREVRNRYTGFVGCFYPDRGGCDVISWFVQPASVPLTLRARSTVLIMDRISKAVARCWAEHHAFGILTAEIVYSVSNWVEITIAAPYHDGMEEWALILIGRK